MAENIFPHGFECYFKEYDKKPKPVKSISEANLILFIDPFTGKKIRLTIKDFLHLLEIYENYLITLDNATRRDQKTRNKNIEETLKLIQSYINELNRKLQNLHSKDIQKDNTGSNNMINVDEMNKISQKILQMKNESISTTQELQQNEDTIINNNDQGFHAS